MLRLLTWMGCMAAAIWAGPALAHPHIFIDAEAVIAFDTNGAVSEIRHRWTFDEAFSAWTVQGLDTDGDGATSPEEMQEFANENLTGLAEYGYYTSMGEGEETIPLAAAGGPSMQFQDGRSTLQFAVRPQAPYTIGDALELSVADPEYYVSITFAGPESIVLENAPEGCGVTLEPPREMAPELADQLYALPPEVTELPPALAAALRGVQGAVVITCGGDAAPATAEQAVNLVGQASQGPFGGPPTEPGLALPRAGFFLWLAEQQRAFYVALTDALGRLRADGNAFYLLGALSFLYGIVHAAGPGHGKIVIGSYMLANESELRRGIVLSFASAMLQSLVAVGLVSAAALLLDATSRAMSDAANWIGIASYGLVAALGMWLVARKVFGWGHDHRHSHRHAPGSLAAKARGHLHEGNAHDHHHHGDHHHHDRAHEDHGEGTLEHHGRAHHHIVAPASTKGSWKEQLGVVLAVGARPCSGALVVLVFALSQDVFAAGIVAVFLMGLGTALTVAVLAGLAVGAKGLAVRFAGVDGTGTSTVLWWLELFGALAVFAFGALLLAASL